MDTNLQVYESAMALVTAKGRNYMVTPSTGGASVMLKRDVDFGVIPKTKKPSLYKAGAEKVCMAYGLLQHFDIVSCVEDVNPKSPLFAYTIKCSLVKIGADGREYVFTTGFGSANTNEARNGMNSAWNAANSTLKMAQKRALVSAAISISGMSDAFTQDMEDETFMAKGKDLLASDSQDAPISTAQIRRIYAIGGNAGLTTEEVKTTLASMGFASTKSITQKDYNAVCEAIEKKGDNK